MMMRPLLLTADLPPRTWSGVGSAVAAQAGALSDLGVAVQVLAPASAPRPLRTGTAPVVIPLAADRFPLPPESFDIVHLHSLALAELAVELCRRHRVPLVTTVHALVHRELAPSPFAAAWTDAQAAVLAASDHVLLLSAAERAAALERDPALAGRCSVLPNGVRAPAPPSRARRGIGALPTSVLHPSRGPRCHRVAFAGRFTAGKGVDLLAGVVERFAARDDVEFVIAGGHGDDDGHRTVAALARRFPQRCRVTGWLDAPAVDALLAGADLVVVPSEYEPFGMVALEALRVGTPVVAADAGGLAETLRGDSGGVVIPSRDADDWSRAIGALLDDTARRRALGARGPAHVARHFDVARLARRLVAEVYAPLDARRPVPCR